MTRLNGNDFAVRVLAAAGVLVTAGLLAGCPAVIIGGTASTAVVASDSRTAGSVLEDQSIELKAAKRIGDDAELSGRVHVNVTSYNQIVLLSGEAPTAELKQKAVDLVRRVEKVRLVHDELALMAPSSLTSRSSDTLITARVKTALFGVKGFDATRVKVVTERGVVYLMGLLPKDQGEVAANTASTINGVQKVVKLFEYGA